MLRNMLLTSWLFAAGACGAGEVADAGGPTSTGKVDTSETGGGSTSTSTSASETPTSTSGGTTAGEDFVVGPDVGGTITCDSWTQDCREGEKCTAWAADGGTAWNATKCVPVTGQQKPGEPCTAEGGGVSGVDDCVEGAMCWQVDAGGKGQCVALCTGSEEAPVCEELNDGCGTTQCAITNAGALNICLDSCDPLAQDCPGDDRCLPVSGTFVCFLDAGESGAVFDPCEFANSCDKGLLCAAATAAIECDQEAVGCCVPMCSIAAGDAGCPGVGQQCLPIHDPPTDGCEDVGYCTVMR